MHTRPPSPGRIVSRVEVDRADFVAASGVPFDRPARVPHGQIAARPRPEPVNVTVMSTDLAVAGTPATPRMGTPNATRAGFDVVVEKTVTAGTNWRAPLT